MSRKRLIFDVDGIILNFNTQFVRWWNHQYSRKLSPYPRTWDFDINSSEVIYPNFRAKMEEFHHIHDHLPLEHDDIPRVINRLSRRYDISLVTSYPYAARRIQNLALHNIYYDELNCGVQDKTAFITPDVVSIFEDGPQHISKYLDIIDSQTIWIPTCYPYAAKYRDHPKAVYYSDPKEWLKLLDIEEI